MTDSTMAMIKHVDFLILDKSRAEKLAVAKIDSSNFNTNQSGISAPGSVCDPRLGTISQKVPCKHCGQNPQVCPGHCGIIELHKPVFHPYFLDTTLKFLKSVCFWCSNPLVKNIVFPAKLSTKAKIQFVCNATQGIKLEKINDVKVLVCPTCKGYQPTYTKNGMLIQAQFPDAEYDEDMTEAIKDVSFDANNAMQILCSVPESFSQSVGLEDPTTLLSTFVMVMPNRIRPGMNLGDKKSPDDLTVRFLDIIKCNNVLKSNPNNKDAYNDLQHSVGFMLNSEIKSVGNVSSQLVRPIKSLVQKLRGKKGILRANATGKRSNFTGRSVVTPTLCDIDTVCLPEEFMTTLTIPVKVCVKNINEIMNCVRKGPGKLDGADRIEKQLGNIIYLQHCKDIKKIDLQIGDIVHRYIRKGDYVLLNRQPSLHKYSILALKVEVSKYAKHNKIIVSIIKYG